MGMTEDASTVLSLLLRKDFTRLLCLHPSPPREIYRLELSSRVLSTFMLLCLCIHISEVNYDNLGHAYK